jgi:hypothetical protein
VPHAARDHINFRLNVSKSPVIGQVVFVEQRSARQQWQAVALEVVNGLGKAILLIGSIVTGIVLVVVLTAMSS